MHSTNVWFRGSDAEEFQRYYSYDTFSVHGHKAQTPQERDCPGYAPTWRALNTPKGGIASFLDLADEDTVKEGHNWHPEKG